MFVVLNMFSDLQKKISNKFFKLTYFRIHCWISSAELIFKSIISVTDPP